MAPDRVGAMRFLLHLRRVKNPWPAKAERMFEDKDAFLPAGLHKFYNVPKEVAASK